VLGESFARLNAGAGGGDVLGIIFLLKGIVPIPSILGV
jgi:hypothetical protein